MIKNTQCWVYTKFGEQCRIGEIGMRGKDEKDCYTKTIYNNSNFDSVGMRSSFLEKRKRKTGNFELDSSGTGGDEKRAEQV